MLSFIDSPFRTKVEYDAWLSLPQEQQQAALKQQTEAAAAFEQQTEVLGEEAAAKAVSYDPLDFPESRIAHLKGEFDELAAGTRLPLKAVHRLLFTDEERSEYDFDTWDQDLQATCEGCKRDMSWEDIVKFLKENL
uniref:Uncharacterized protein n=1 Tax=Haptolina brevifila TaxID=156173 RepID=A0A7S2FLW1_9EUKA|mmetsp:Transcript_14793/g.29738  ORF Transcript_14793/g.29738 Transcript_14793/m.29738 type:complete len:136 (+) Transcript_14793:74-481(+)|eukprot:CAMPEP_0174725820 /NCGR_PEP_ID=MMETSP1094-20130205/46457_1 /TAXON_ID=156173 /ORGANISM="Chrysochromulina brevifilum, Strain UTEX LB 985" /LENGTH=135 /DNA_ID=CAMNT_0015927295 /DNA_START=74 /DNA_END=481 /DNA_ORIENTATION=+